MTGKGNAIFTDSSFINLTTTFKTKKAAPESGAAFKRFKEIKFICLV